MPDLSCIRKELLKNGVNKKLLWTEYMEECHLNNEEPLMYSQFCYHIQQDEQKRRATMHINRKLGEQVEVDWAGDPARIIDSDMGEIIPAYILVGVMAYSQYTYVEAFINEKQRAWITVHVHMYEYFGGVAKILVSDNFKTVVIHNNDWYNQQLNMVYHEMAEHCRVNKYRIICITLHFLFYHKLLRENLHIIPMNSKYGLIFYIQSNVLS